MAGKTAVLALKITGDASGGARALEDTDERAGRLAGTFGKMGAGIAAGVGVGVVALGGLAVSAFDAASELQQSTGAIDSVFGDWAIDIEQSAQAAAGSVGLSTSAYENLAAVLGSQLKGAGMPIDEVTSKTQGLVATGADLAATFGGTTEEAVSALSSVLKGETDPIERYGVSLKQSDINARLAALGQDKLEGAALKTATANAALALVTEQTTSAAGAFGRESDTAAGAQQRLSATWENAKAALGERLLPVVAGAANFLTTTVLPAFTSLTSENGFLTVAFGAVSDFVTGTLVPAVSSLWTEIGPKLVPILQTAGGVLTDTLVPAFKAVWAIVQDYVFPIIGSVLGPALSGVKTLWDNLATALEDNRGKFVAIYENIQPFLAFLRDQVAPFVGGALKLAFETLGSALKPVVSTISWLLEKASAVTGFLGSVGSFLFGGPESAGGGGATRGAPLRGAARGRLFGAAGSVAGGGLGGSSSGGGVAVPIGDTYNITVNGALDPDAVAAQLESMLTRRLRATGRLSAVGAGAFG